MSLSLSEDIIVIIDDLDYGEQLEGIIKYYLKQSRRVNLFINGQLEVYKTREKDGKTRDKSGSLQSNDNLSYVRNKGLNMIIEESETNSLHKKKAFNISSMRSIRIDNNHSKKCRNNSSVRNKSKRNRPKYKKRVWN